MLEISKPSLTRLLGGYVPNDSKLQKAKEELESCGIGLEFSQYYGNTPMVGSPLVFVFGEKERVVPSGQSYPTLRIWYTAYKGGVAQKFEKSEEGLLQAFRFMKGE